ncbi:MAG: hypothetical protein LLG13_18640 [Bacteroidales bacterium]|nr:hypothetical protein [Bacteroidales bacterium]
MDFTLKTYKTLIKTLQQQGFSFLSFEEFISKPEDKAIVLRHDVDSLPHNSLEFAKIEADMGIKGTYYFRVVPGSWDEAVIRRITELGHEVGYHYEDVGATAQRRNGTMVRWLNGIMVQRQKNDHKTILPYDSKTARLHDCKTVRPQDRKLIEEELVLVAIKSFKENLAKLRELVPVKTICMHGSPLSKWDSRLLWKYYDYHDFGLIGEPYFDIDFDEVMYLTDTGRRWDGGAVSVRDKAVGGRQKAEVFSPAPSPRPSALRPPPSALHLQFHSTFDIIIAAERGELQDKIMLTFHPQRWTDKPLPWMKELVWQNVKNTGKYFLVKTRDQELGIMD